MSNRTPRIVLTARMFGVYFVLTLLVSWFWNGLSGMNMFPFNAVIGVAAVMTVLTIVIGSTTSTVGSQILLKDDPQFQKWKAEGGRPYWDFIGWPVNEWPNQKPTQESSDADQRGS